jgi:hypothetical protein
MAGAQELEDRGRMTSFQSRKGRQQRVVHGKPNRIFLFSGRTQLSAPVKIVLLSSRIEMSCCYIQPGTVTLYLSARFKAA